MVRNGIWSPGVGKQEADKAQFWYVFDENSKQKGAGGSGGSDVEGGSLMSFCNVLVGSSGRKQYFCLKMVSFFV